MMTHSTRLLACVVLTMLMAWLSSHAAAQAGALRALEQRHEQVNRILRQPARDEAARRRRSAQLTRLLNELLDYEALSREALGPHWEARGEQERERFVSLLRQLVERNYEQNLERILDFEVRYDAERRRDDGNGAIVTTTARSRENRRQPPVEIEYTMTSQNGRWRVVDVTTDDVSMVESYRNQFNRIIARDGWDSLIERMERRLEQGETD